MSDTLSLRALNRAMLARQLLLEPSSLSPRVALERVAGLQAQWPKLPFMGLWTRLANFKREDLADALRRRQAVRATMMRGTIHVVSAKDYIAMRGPIQAVLTRGVSPVKEHVARLDTAAVLAAARKLFAAPHTFDEVRDANLRAIDARHLFAVNLTKLAIRRGRFLRSFVYDFIETFASPLTRAVVEEALATAPGEASEA